MKADKIIKTIVDISGRKQEEIESCPFWDCEVDKEALQVRGFCTRKDVIECKYGLTDIQVPKDCPLKKSSITTNVCLKQ